MKIRSSFVSNSSSSSYIIEFKDIFDFATIAGEVFSIINFIDAIESINDLETEINGQTFNKESREDFISMLDKMIGWGGSKESMDELKKIKDDVIKYPEKNFVRFKLSYHNKALRFIFSLLKKYDVLKVRYAEND